ncbi:MAG: hypothetical protein LUQ31_08785 [Methanoregula sp.]|nr:hypothetical protein [Methanoregula sp.]
MISLSPSLSSAGVRRFVAAFLSWLVPFVVAIPFYGNGGRLLISTDLFKSLMIVVSAVTAALLIIWFSRSVRSGYTREGIVTGIVWLFVNWVLDLIVLVGLLGMPLPVYAAQVGLRYLMIPAIVIATGVVADEAVLRIQPQGR